MFYRVSFEEVVEADSPDDAIEQTVLLGIGSLLQQFKAEQVEKPADWIE